MFDIPKQEEIPEKTQELRNKFEELDLQRKVLLAHLDFLQGICKHPQTVTRSAMGKETWKECLICGKEI